MSIREGVEGIEGAGGGIDGPPSAPSSFSGRSPAIVLAAAIVLWSAAPFAQAPTRSPQVTGDPGNSSAPDVRPFLLDVSRVEGWSFFDPAENGGDPTYLIAGNRATLGVRVNGTRIEFQGAFQYAQLVGLPRHSFGPGPLGAGASFFDAAGSSEAYQLYFRSMSLRVKNVVPHLSIEGGRMSYQSGDATAAAGWLIGNAEWTIFERSFDGLRADYDAADWRAHAAFLMPTQGAFEESANPTMPDVQLASVSWTRGNLQLFAHQYRDRRQVAARPDNTGLRADAVDVNLQTVGAFYGTAIDALEISLWGAVQRGDWYGSAHRALSVAGEAAYGWTRARWRPQIGGGIRYASGDDDPDDTTHETFFPMVPTTRPDVLGGTYAQMNLRDIYARGRLHPRGDLAVSGEVHHLSLASALDRWYSGTGATTMRGNYFGYSTRQSRLRTGLGTFVQGTVEAPLGRYWTLAATAGLVKGGDVVRRQFSGTTLSVFVVESRIAWR